jgi:opacity protein-like surface antigen
MHYLLKRLIVIVMLAVAAAPAPFAQAQACTSSWSKTGYKSYAQIKREVNQRLGNARIVRVELCGSGASAYFRVIAIAGSTREELRISAR